MSNYEDILDRPLRPARSFPIFLLLLVVGSFIFVVAELFIWVYPSLFRPEKFVTVVMPPDWLLQVVRFAVSLLVVGLVGSWRRRKEKNWLRRVLMVFAGLVVLASLLELLFLAYLQYFY
ncbi:MAG: hypothetical protein AAFN92_16520 [Bacteroidota bacterium]